MKRNIVKFKKIVLVEAWLFQMYICQHIAGEKALSGGNPCPARPVYIRFQACLTLKALN